MRAVVSRAHGPIDDLAVDEFAEPELPPGVARLDVPGSGVDDVDDLIVGGHHRVTAPTPVVPGAEFVDRASGKPVIVP